MNCRVISFFIFQILAHDCFEIASVAYEQQDYYHVILWAEEALEKKDESLESEILEYLAYALYEQGNLKRALRGGRKFTV